MKEIKDLFYSYDSCKKEFNDIVSRKVTLDFMMFNDEKELLFKALDYKNERWINHVVNKTYNEAIDKGKKEGHAKGLEEGKVQVKLDIVKSKLNEGISIEVISKCSGLSIDEIEKINN